MPLDRLVAAHATPFFLISERRLKENYQALAAGLAAAGGEVTLRYCAKTNNEAGVLAPLARLGSSLLASHLAEVEIALRCGFPAARIAYQRPAPPRAEVDDVLGLGVELLHVFRPADAELFAERARRMGKRVRISLRLRDERRSLSPLSSLNARLGLSTEEARQVAALWGSGDVLRVSALNAYVGTQQSGLRAFDRSLRRVCSLARQLRAEGLAEIAEINIGGGIPSPSLLRVGARDLWRRWRDRAAAGDDRGAVTRLEAFGRRLAARYRLNAAACGLVPAPALAAEPGRSIVGNAAVLISKVVSAEAGWLFLDASRNFLGESPLLFSRRIATLHDHDGGRRRFVHLSGSTLNTTDVLDLHRRLPGISAGDALVFCDAGAYSISRASRYAGLSPAVLLLRTDGTVRLIRRPETSADLAGPMSPALGGGELVT